jgi:glycine hydroxymethyltransferase
LRRLVLKPTGGTSRHGMKLNLSGRFYKPVHYPLHYAKDHPEFERINYDARRRVRASTEAEDASWWGYSAYPRMIDFREVPRAIADECGALLVADIAHIAGLMASACIRARSRTRTS